MPLLKVENISSLPAHRMLSKLTAISMMAMQSLFPVMVLILAEHGFTVVDLISIKEPMPAHYTMPLTLTIFFRFTGSSSWNSARKLWVALEVQQFRTSL